MSVWNPQVQRTFAEEQAMLNGNVAAISGGFNSVVHAGIGVQGTVHRDAHVAAGMGGSLKVALTPSLQLIDYIVHAAMPTQIASPGEAIAAFTANTMSPEEAGRCAQLHGVAPDHFASAMRAARRKPEAVEANILRNRQVLNDEQHRTALRNLGFTDDFERLAIASLRSEVPGPSDLVRFAVRHAFEPEILSALGYHAEYRPALDFYHQTAGLNYPIFTGPLKQTIIATSKEFPEIFDAVVEYAKESNVAPPASAEQVPDWFANRYKSLGLPEPTWAVMFWWSHWVLPSPGQGYECLQRLRGDPKNPATWRIPGVPPFTSDDLNLLLRANDYPPFWRKRLEAISYRVQGIRQLRVQIQQGTITDAEVVEVLRDNGFVKKDAESYALALTDDVREKSREKKFRAVKRELDQGWDLGLVTDEEFLAAYADAGFAADQAHTELQAAVMGRSVRLGRELLKQVKRGYMRGSFDRNQAATFMTQIGINARRQAEYLKAWDAERQAGRIQLTASQLQRAAKDNLLDLGSYATRLRNLDFSDDAINLLLAEARLVRSTQERKALEQIAKADAATAKERLAALKAAQQQQKELVRQLAAHGTPANLRTWFCNGDISSVDVTNRLRALLWPQEDIDRLLGECDAKREKLGLAPYSEEAPGAEA